MLWTARCTATSDDGGGYLFENLKPGRYTLSAAKQGFSASSTVNLELTARRQRAYYGAALMTSCADYGDKLLIVRHCNPPWGRVFADGDKVGYYEPSFKPVLFDIIHLSER